MKMKMPGFTAESSLYRARISYGTDVSIGKFGETVYPATLCNFNCMDDCLGDIPDCGELPPNLAKHCGSIISNYAKRCRSRCCH